MDGCNQCRPGAVELPNIGRFRIEGGYDMPVCCQVPFCIFGCFEGIRSSAVFAPLDQGVNGGVQLSFCQEICNVFLGIPFPAVEVRVLYHGAEPWIGNPGQPGAHGDI